MKTKSLIIVRLVHLEGPCKGQIQEFSEKEILIGRHPECQVRFPLDHAIISRKHAKIAREGDVFKFFDQSTNGTFVNGKKTKEAVLQDGDVLVFAKGGPKISFLTRISNWNGNFEPEPVYTTDGKSAADAGAEISKRRAAPKETEKENQPRNCIEPSECQDHASFPPQREIQPRRTNVPISVVFGPTTCSFNELPVVIGKNPDCDYRMEHPQIFEHHAQVFFHREQYWIKDLTGKKLVLIDGAPVDPQAPLTANCIVGLTPKGPDFRFQGQGSLVEIEKRPAPLRENAEEDSECSHEASLKGQKKPSLIQKLLRN